MIKTFIINLKTSTTRKEYMIQLLSGYTGMDISFLEAVDGRSKSDKEISELFDLKKSLLRYGRKINNGEIGCTLSHHKCYDAILKSGYEYCLILEDDISIIGDLDDLYDKTISNFMVDEQPRIMFLSGDYWYWKKKRITNVFSAVGSYAYFINLAAVRKIKQHIDRPFNLADDWDVYKNLGVKLFAIHPYLIDANITDLESDIHQDYWGNKKSLMSMKNILRSYYCGLIKRFLILCGHFESKVR